MNSFIKNISIKGRILALSSSLIAIIVAVSLFSLFSIRYIGDELESIAEQDIPLTNSLTTITVHQLEQAIHFERLLHLGYMQSMTHFAEQVESFKALDKKIVSEITAIEELARNAVADAKHELERTEFEYILHGVEKFEEGHKEYSMAAETVIALFNQGKIQEAQGLAEKVEVTEDKIDHELEELLEEINTFTAHAATRAEEHEHTAEYLLTLITVVSIFLGVGLSRLVSSSTQTRLDEVANSLGLMASGDFTENVSSDDEIARPMKLMRDQLVNMIGNINTTANQLLISAEDLSSTTSQTKTNMQIQKTETEQVTTAMSDLSLMVREVSDNVQSVSDTAIQSNEEAVKGASVVDLAVSGINELSEKINDASAVIINVENDSQNINTVLEVIKGIADQTNLLALNAAIEAARAGEQGRGFAVVADEVRTLAVRTQDSTAEINQIIESLNSASKEAVSVMTESQEQTQAVVEKAELAGASLNTIVESILKIVEMTEKIATATHEQSTVTESMSKNALHINDIAVKNSEGIEQIHQTGEKLLLIASDLRESVEYFKLNDSPLYGK